ncbi:MAG: hypothetical protein ACRYGR_03510 [Janthinobacterium lividum]
MTSYLKKIRLSSGMFAILSLSGHQASAATPHPLIQEMVTKIQQMKNSESVCVAGAFFRKKGGENCSSYDFAMLGLATCGNFQGFKTSDCGKKISSVLGH